MAEEITYIPYGQDEISQQDLMTSLANGLPDFMNQYKWLKKPSNREAFLEIYSNIVKGLVGASDSTGLWEVNSTYDTSNLSPLGKEMAGHAAHYIQQKMAQMTPRKKEEEKKKEDLDKFDFVSSFGKQLLNLYGGNSKLFEDSEQGWNTLDTRGENGLRGTSERKKEMAKQLELYKRDLEGKDYNFEGTSFKDKQDALTKLQAAIDALKNTPDDESDDLPAFSALGLNYRGFFSNGGNEASTHTDENGNPYTWNQWNELQQKLAKQKEAEAVKAAAAKRANQYTNFKFYQFNLSGTPLTTESAQSLLNKINTGQDLDGNDISGLNWAFKQALKTGGLQNLSKEELAKFGSRYASTPNRLKKLPELEGIYYDSVANRLIRPYKQSEQSVGGTTLSSLIAQNSPEALAKKQQEQQLQAANRKLDKGWETEDYLRMGAMAQDITGAIAAWLPGYGTAASGALGLTSLGTNLAADIADKSLTKWDVAKNAGMNLALAGVGMVPGLGLASKTGKWITNVAKWAPRLLTLQAIKDLPDSYNSLQKAINKPNELTNADWRNIAYGLSVVAGLSRGAAGVANHRRYKPAFSEGTEKQYTVTTSKGKKTITKEQVDKIKKLDPKDKEKYTEEIKKTLKLADDETFDIKDIKAFGKTLKSKGIEIKEETVPTGLSSKATAYREYLENLNNSMKNGEGIYKYAPRFLPTNYDIYKGAANLQMPGFNLSERIKNAWNPLSDKNLQKKGIKVVEEAPKATTQQPTTQPAQQSVKAPTSKNGIRRDWKNTIERGNFTNNEITPGDYKVGHFNIKVSKNSNGEYIIHTDLPSSTTKGPRPQDLTMKQLPKTFKTQKELQKEIAKIVSESRRRANLSDSNGKKAGINHKEIGKILRDLKAKGWLKRGGTINNPLDTIIEDFFKNNNI